MRADPFSNLFHAALEQEFPLAKAVITSPALENGGKLKPAKPGSLKKPKKCGCNKAEDEACKCDGASTSKTSDPVDMCGQLVHKLYFPIEKASDEKQIVTGVVLVPETVDAQGDIISRDVIEKAAFEFLAAFGKQTKLGLQHNSFKKQEDRFSLAESYIAPMDFVLGTKTVTAGSWVMSVRIHDAKIWKSVKDGKITGFSIGGRARAKKVAA